MLNRGYDGRERKMLCYLHNTARMYGLDLDEWATLSHIKVDGCEFWTYEPDEN